jgi:hypothetical protein
MEEIQFNPDLVRAGQNVPIYLGLTPKGVCANVVCPHEKCRDFYGLSPFTVASLSLEH